MPPAGRSYSPYHRLQKTDIHFLEWVEPNRLQMPRRLVRISFSTQRQADRPSSNSGGPVFSFHASASPRKAACSTAISARWGQHARTRLLTVEESKSGETHEPNPDKPLVSAAWSVVMDRRRSSAGSFFNLAFERDDGGAIACGSLKGRPL